MGKRCEDDVRHSTFAVIECREEGLPGMGCGQILGALTMPLPRRQISRYGEND